MNHIPIAVQLFTLRKESEQNFAETLKKVAEIGYDGVEFAGFGGLAAEQVKELLTENGLRAAASHVPLEDIQKNLPQVIKDQKTIGSRYIVCPFLLPEQRTESGYRALFSILNEAEAACRKEGIQLCYHNHDFELERLADGRMALEAILEETAAAAEFDIYWLEKAGEQPGKWMERYKGRTPLIHLKDMTKDKEMFFAELGTGGVDLEAVFQASRQTNVDWWIVEQDETRRSPFKSIEISLDYLKNRRAQEETS